MNKGYERGRRAEYMAVKQLEAAGYKAVRSAGSHGLWDVMAVNANGVRLIQVKSDEDVADVKYECKVAAEKMSKLTCPANVSLEVWGRVHGKKGWLIQCDIKEVGE